MVNCLFKLLFRLNTFAIVTSIICQRCVIKKIFDVEQPCTTCEGTQCFVLVYKYRYPILSYTNAFQMDCITSNSITFPTGCRINKDGDKLCVCDDRDNCNTEQYPIMTTQSYIPTVLCNKINNFANGTCIGHRCTTHMSTIGSGESDCLDVRLSKWPVLSTFDLFAYPNNIFIPNGICAYFKFSDSESTMTCSLSKRIDPTDFEIPRTISCIAEHQYTDYEMSCRSDYCFASRTPENVNTYGCFSYGKSEKYNLKPGLFAVGQNKLFLCNTDMCNKYIDADGKTRKPTDYSKKEETGNLAGINCSCPASPRPQNYSFSTTYSLIMTISFVYLCLIQTH